MDYYYLNRVLSGQEAGTIGVVFDDSDSSKWPLKKAGFRRGDDTEELMLTMLQTGQELRLGVCADRNDVYNWLGRQSPPLSREEELRAYQKRGCMFRRSSAPESNCYTVTPPEGGRVLIANEGRRSLRFAMPDGSLYRVPAGRTAPLEPGTWAAARTKVLLELGGVFDTGLQAVYTLEDLPGAVWCEGEIQSDYGSKADSYYVGIVSGDDFLGMLEVCSDWLGSPGVEIADISSFGPSEWYVRNSGRAPAGLREYGAEGWKVMIPPDKQVYSVEKLLSGMIAPEAGAGERREFEKSEKSEESRESKEGGER